MTFIFSLHVPHELRDLVYTALFYSKDSDSSLVVHWYGSGCYSNCIEKYSPDECNGRSVACICSGGKLDFVAPSLLEKYPQLWENI